MKLIDDLLIHPSTLTLLAHCLIVTVLAVRVIMKKPAVGVGLAWILFISTTPFVGAGFYLLIGERRIDQRWWERIQSLRLDYAEIGKAVIEEGLTHVKTLCSCLRPTTD